MYCTIEEIISSGMPEKTLAELSNDINPLIVESSVVNDLISESTEYIDGFLRTRYTLPLINIHQILKDVCIDIVKYKLFKRRDKTDDRTDKLLDDAKSTLKAIQRGELILNETLETVRYGFYKANVRQRVFTDELLDTF
jgi:phage gp36-like protein